MINVAEGMEGFHFFSAQKKRDRRLSVSCLHMQHVVTNE